MRPLLLPITKLPSFHRGVLCSLGHGESPVNRLERVVQTEEDLNVGLLRNGRKIFCV